MDEAPESLSSSISPSDGEVPLILPNGITTNGEYTILVQIDPEDTLDFTGATGAVGRFEVEDEEVVLDLKGNIYRGRLYPTTTMVVASLASTALVKTLKIDSLADEFCRVIKSGNTLETMKGIASGNTDDYDVAPSSLKHRTIARMEKKGVSESCLRRPTKRKAVVKGHEPST